MNMKRLVTMGCLSVIVTAGVANASEDATSKVQGMNFSERIGVGGSVYSSSQSDGMVPCSVTGANITERIGHGGSTYSSQLFERGFCSEGRAERSKANISQRIGHGGSIYSISRPTVQAGNK